MNTLTANAAGNQSALAMVATATSAIVAEN